MKPCAFRALPNFLNSSLFFYSSPLSSPFSCVQDAAEMEKPVVVRVKRKQFQEPVEAFWLEINERPRKKPLLDIGKLSISDAPSSSTQHEDAKNKKVFVQRVETVSSSEVAKHVLESFLDSIRKHMALEKPHYDESSAARKKIEERRHMLKENYAKQSHLHERARQSHETLAKDARFKQIWMRRRSDEQKTDAELHKICHLYDVERIDSEDQIPNGISHTMGADDDVDDASLSKFLPLLKEFLPTAATEVESDLISKQENYVYDIYTVEDDINGNEENKFIAYPLVHVNDDDDDYYDGPSESEYDSEDSNAENSDLHDYPDEESSEDEEKSEEDVNESDSEFDDLDGYYYDEYEEQFADLDKDEKE